MVPFGGFGAVVEGMRIVAVDRLADDLGEYTADVFASFDPRGLAEPAGWYLRGAMLDGAT
jgi:hypothetical protein